MKIINQQRRVGYNKPIILMQIQTSLYIHIIKSRKILANYSTDFDLLKDTVGLRGVYFKYFGRHDHEISIVHCIKLWF